MSHIGSSIGNAVGNVVGGITGAKQAGEAAQAAAGVQAAAAQSGIDEQKRQFDELVKIMSPYVGAGTQALTAQQNILGLGGNDAQKAAIDQIQNSPYFTAMAQQGQNAMLQSASATGGLRGGDMQAALSQYQPQLLNQLVQQQYQNLGGITQIGQASAAGQASAGMNSANSIANLLGQQGAATAGGVMGQGSVASRTFGDLLNIGSLALGAKKAGMF